MMDYLRTFLGYYLHFLSVPTFNCGYETFRLALGEVKHLKLPQISADCLLHESETKGNLLSFTGKQK